MVNKLFAFFFVLLFLFFGYYSFTNTQQESAITGAQTQSISTLSRAEIVAFIAISASQNFTDGGIDFLQVTPGTTNNNATGNFNSSKQSEYFISVLPSTNVNVDFCIRSNTNLTTGAVAIPFPNYRFSNETQTDANRPGYPPNVLPINANDTFTRETTGVAPGGKDYYRFYLDVPAAQQPGVYSNTVIFRAVRTGTVDRDCVTI